MSEKTRQIFRDHRWCWVLALASFMALAWLYQVWDAAMPGLVTGLVTGFGYLVIPMWYEKKRLVKRTELIDKYTETMIRFCEQYAMYIKMGAAREAAESIEGFAETYRRLDDQLKGGRHA